MESAPYSSAVGASSSVFVASSAFQRRSRREASTRTPSARPFRCSNSASSVPVRKACRPSASISSKSAARRSRSRCAATSSSNNIGFGCDFARESRAAWAKTRFRISAFCSPVEHSAAGRPRSRWTTARSPRCGPVSARPAAASRGLRGGQIGGQARLDFGRARAPASASCSHVAGEAERGLRERAVAARGRSRPAARSASRARASAIRAPASAMRRLQRRRARPDRRPPRPAGACARAAPARRRRRAPRGSARRRTPAGRRTAAARPRPPGTAGPAPASARAAAGARPGGRAARSRPRCAPVRRAAPGVSTPVPSRTAPPSPLDLAPRPPRPGPAPRRARAARARRGWRARMPRPGENRLIASSRLVLPAPFGPNRKTLRPPSAQLGALVGAEIGERQGRNGGAHQLLPLASEGKCRKRAPVRARSATMGRAAAQDCHRTPGASPLRRGSACGASPSDTSPRLREGRSDVLTAPRRPRARRGSSRRAWPSGRRASAFRRRRGCRRAARACWRRRSAR